MNIFKKSQRERSSTASSASAVLNGSTVGIANAGSGYATPDEQSLNNAAGSFSLMGLTATLKRAKGKALGQLLNSNLNSVRESTAINHGYANSETLADQIAKSDATVPTLKVSSTTSSTTENVPPDFLPGYKVSQKNAIILRHLELTDRSCCSSLAIGTNITVIDLSFNNLKTVPEQIFQMTQLKKLYLCHNQIETVTHNLARLKLTHLALSSNLISSHDLQIADLGNWENHVSPLSRSLEALWLDGNRLNSIGMLLYNFGNLKNLSISRNQITHISQDAIPPKVQYLCLSYNLLECVPQALLEASSLMAVGLSGNAALESSGFRLLSCLRNKCSILEIPPAAVNQTRSSVIVANAHVVRVGKRALESDTAAAGQSLQNSLPDGAKAAKAIKTSRERLDTGAPGVTFSDSVSSSSKQQPLTVNGFDSREPAVSMLMTDVSYLEGAVEAMNYARDSTVSVRTHEAHAERDGAGLNANGKGNLDYWTKKPINRHNVISVLPHIKFDINKLNLSSQDSMPDLARNLSRADSFNELPLKSDARELSQTALTSHDRQHTVESVYGLEKSHLGNSYSSNNVGSEDAVFQSSGAVPLKPLNKRLAQLKLDQSMSELRSLMESGQSANGSSSASSKSENATLEIKQHGEMRSSVSTKAVASKSLASNGPPPVRPKPSSFKDGFLTSKSEEF